MIKRRPGEVPGPVPGPDRRRPRELAPGLGEQLAELELISEENPGKPRWQVDLGTGVRVNGIEVDHPDGPRLYALEGVDTIVATRVRDDGRFEHAVLDEDGLPIEWRAAYRPDFN